MLLLKSIFLREQQFGGVEDEEKIVTQCSLDGPECRGRPGSYMVSETWD
jgi:hypothetical protein